ncbi:MAG: hypothetical protein ACLTER_11275 [Ruminococcus sp.]
MSEATSFAQIRSWPVIGIFPFLSKIRAVVSMGQERGSQGKNGICKENAGIDYRQFLCNQYFLTEV